MNFHSNIGIDTSPIRLSVDHPFSNVQKDEDSVTHQERSYRQPHSSSSTAYAAVPLHVMSTTSSASTDSVHPATSRLNHNVDSHSNCHENHNEQHPYRNERWTIILIVHVLLRTLENDVRKNNIANPNHINHGKELCHTAKAIIRDCIVRHKQIRAVMAVTSMRRRDDSNHSLIFMIRERLKEVHGLSEYFDHAERYVGSYWDRRSRIGDDSVRNTINTTNTQSMDMNINGVGVSDFPIARERQNHLQRDRVNSSSSIREERVDDRGPFMGL